MGIFVPDWIRDIPKFDIFGTMGVLAAIIVGEIYPPSGIAPLPASTIATQENSNAVPTGIGSGESASSVANVRGAAFGAKGDGQADDTAAIQAAIDQYDRVHIPAGIYRINPKVGLILRTGTQLSGDGRTATLLVAAPGGGSLKDLASYGSGSLIRRRFDLGHRNEYVSYVRLTDFSVILNHPRASVTTDQIQIGIDFRNISRSSIERVHVGNVIPEGTRFRKATAHVHDSQGYGIALGTVQSSLVSYAGGELNIIRDVSIWGAYKAIAQDDAELSPRSAAHATKIEHSDIQGAQYLLSQESRYTRGTVWRDNILQNVVPRPDDIQNATVVHIDSQDARVEGGYVEAGGLSRYIVFLGMDTKRVSVMFDYTSCTNTPENFDGGTSNRILMTPDCAVKMRSN